MNARTKPVAAEEYAVELSRVFDAPPILVFKAFSKPEHLVRWWGPKDFATTVERLEFQEGGSYRMIIHGRTAKITACRACSARSSSRRRS